MKTNSIINYLRSVFIISILFSSCKPSTDDIAEKYIKALNSYDIGAKSNLLCDTIIVDSISLTKSSLLFYTDTAKYIGIRYDNFKIISSNDSIVQFSCNVNQYADSMLKTLNYSQTNYTYKIRQGKIFCINHHSILDSAKRAILNSKYDELNLYISNNYEDEFELKNFKKYINEYAHLSEKEKMNLSVQLLVTGNTFTGRINGIMMSFKFKKNGRLELYFNYVLQTIDDWEIEDGKLYLVSGVYKEQFIIENGGRSLYSNGMFTGRYFSSEYWKAKGFDF
jgi:hypothetical protein